MNDMNCTCTDLCADGFNPFCECTHDQCSCAQPEHLIGKQKAVVFYLIKDFINNHYEMNQGWKQQTVKTKKWKYEYKFSKSGKTFCGFYLTDNCLGFMLIFGKQEREKVEEIRGRLTSSALDVCDSAKVYHDGKWVMFELEDESLLEDIKLLLTVKKQPTKR